MDSADHPADGTKRGTPAMKRRCSDASESECVVHVERGLDPKPARPKKRKRPAPPLDQASDGSTSAYNSEGSGEFSYNLMFDGPTTPADGSPFTIPAFTPPPHTTLQQLTADLDLALQRQWASRQQTRFSKYESAKAFLVSWQEDDLGVELEVNDLARVFEHMYSYQVEKWKIPSRNSQIALDRKIAELVGELDGPSTLLIFYYAGHARPSRQHFGSYPVWRSSRRADAEEVIPVSIQRYLESASADVLFLFDCCHPIHAQSGLKTQGIKEVLAAGGFETVAAEVGDHSFSRFLIDQLARASLDRLSISTSELHGRMLTGLADYATKLVRDEAGQIALDADNQPMFERDRRKTPVHYFMSQKHESIVLAPLLHAAAEPTATAHRAPPANKYSHRMAPEIGEGIIDLKPREPHPQVILRVRLESSEDLNTEAWVDWLKDAPPSAKEIKVEGWFGSFSTLVLLNVPLGIWHMLPDNPAISFVDYVTTPNLASSVTLSTKHAQARSRAISPLRAGGELHGLGEHFDQARDVACGTFTTDMSASEASTARVGVSAHYEAPSPHASPANAGVHVFPANFYPGPYVPRHDSFHDSAVDVNSCVSTMTSVTSRKMSRSPTMDYGFSLGAVPQTIHTFPVLDIRTGWSQLKHMFPYPACSQIVEDSTIHSSMSEDRTSHSPRSEDRETPNTSPESQERRRTRKDQG